MSSAIGIVQTIGLFVAGLLARLGIFLAVLAVLVLPALAIALAARALAARHRRALGLRRVAGLAFRPAAWYAPGHTWLERRPGGAVAIGVDDLAQRLVPSVTAVELPRPGERVARGEVLARLHGGARTVAIRAPLSGTVAGVNAAVLRDPGLVKQDGYGKGWLVAVAPSDDAFEALPRGEAAEAFLRAEAGRFSRFLEDRLGFAAADGGELVSPAPWLVGEEGWSALTAEFLSA